MAESWASSERVRRTMVANRGRDTSPELAVRTLLHARGLRYRVHLTVLPGTRRTVDIAFTRHKLAVFIDGCFWHVCPTHSSMPRTNADYWEPKLTRNSERDRETDALLAAAGWTVLRFWEHDSAEDVADAIQSRIRQRQTG